MTATVEVRERNVAITSSCCECGLTTVTNGISEAAALKVLTLMGWQHVKGRLVCSDRCRRNREKRN